MKADWVIAGGKPGELGHCTRCGDGLTMGMPQRVEVVMAAMRAFVKAHRTCQPGQYTEPPSSVESWPASRGTGISSATIYYVFTGQTVHDHFDVPHDPQDFGRCYRLLAVAPRWEHALWHVSDKFPAWAPFVREWPKLKAMYEEALKTNNGHPLYEFMQTLRAEKPA